MKIYCVFGLHQWDGCKCKACEKTRDQGHDWSKDCGKCVRCGATRNNVHQWNGFKCSVCGKIKDLDLNSARTTADLFKLIGDRPLAGNVQGMFEFTRNSVGGRISYVDITYEIGIELLGVPIKEERLIEIPSDFEKMQIKTVGLPNLKRQREGAPMRLRRI